MIENRLTFITPISIYNWMLTSDMYGLLGFSYNVHHRLLVKDLHLLPVNLIVGFGLLFPDCGCCFVFGVAQSLMMRHP